MYPNNNPQPPYDYQKVPDDIYHTQNHDGNQFPVPRNQSNFMSYPSMYPPQLMQNGQYNYEIPQSYNMYSNFPQMSQVIRNPVNMYPPSLLNQNLPFDASNADIFRGIAMLGRLLDLSNDEKPKTVSPERKKKIVKDDREIRLGNIVFKPSRGDWQCREKTCGNWNYAKRDKCNKCNSFKDREKEDSRVEKKPIRKFWACLECQFQNYEYKEKCYKCGLKKPEGERQSEKSDRYSSGKVLHN